MYHNYQNILSVCVNLIMELYSDILVFFVFNKFVMFSQIIKNVF